MTRHTRARRPLAMALAALLFLAVLPVTALAAESDEQPRLATVADVDFVRAGTTFGLQTFFEDEPAQSNAMILRYGWDAELFEFVGFAAAAQTGVLNELVGEGFARLTLMAPGWQVAELGILTLKARDDAIFTGEAEQISLRLEYVVQQGEGEDGKAILAAEATALVLCLGRGSGPAVEGDTNGDYIVDLLDVSNMIDWFGYNEQTEGWLDWYVYFDFNENGEIDIYDIAYVVRLIMDGRAALNSLIRYAESLVAADYTPETWQALQDVLGPAKTLAADMAAGEAELWDGVRQLQTALAALRKAGSEEGAVVTFAVTPAEAEVTVTDADGQQVEPLAANRLAYQLKPGSYAYRAEAPGYAAQSDTFAVLDEDMTILVELEEVELFPILFALTPAEAEVAVADGEGEPVAPLEDNRLAYQLAAGSYTYAVQAPGYEPASGSFTVEGPATITVALEALAPDVDKSTLLALIEQAEGLAPADYTPESWARLDTALSAARDVMADGDATQTDVDGAADALGAALEGLVEAGEEAIEVESLTISGTVAIKRRATTQLTVTINPENATDQTITWSSLNTARATVDENGLVTAGEEIGFVFIKATAHNGVSATFLLEIMP